MRWAGKGPTPGPGLFEFLGRDPWARRGKGLEAGRPSIGTRSLGYRVRRGGGGRKWREGWGEKGEGQGERSGLSG